MTSSPPPPRPSRRHGEAEAFHIICPAIAEQQSSVRCETADGGGRLPLLQGQLAKVLETAGGGRVVGGWGGGAEVPSPRTHVAERSDPAIRKACFPLCVLS